MKRCPECSRDYYDDSLLYCLDDGSALLEGPAIDRLPDRVMEIMRSENATAAAVIGETPNSFGLLTPPLTSIGIAVHALAGDWQR